jgi:hypothetical protein
MGRNDFFKKGRVAVGLASFPKLLPPLKASESSARKPSFQTWAFHTHRYHQQQFTTFDRNMNADNPIGEDAERIPALQTVDPHANNASCMDLSVIPE